MTFEDAAASLPNGFHDAELLRFEMDYVQRRLQFDLVLWIGDMDDSRSREIYRRARLTLERVAFLVVEPLDSGAASVLKADQISVLRIQARTR